MEEESLHKKLNSGLLFLTFEKMASEPEYEAMGRMTRQRSIIERRQQYSLDLERALTEAKLTTKLISAVGKGIEIDGKSFEPEDLITYYDGIFLDYIHQIKDKILRLVWWMLQDEKSQSKSQLNEPEKIRLRTFTPYEIFLKKNGIYELLTDWNQDSSTGIAVALKKRTQHHHFTSTLQLNSDLQKIRMSKSMLSPASIGTLSDYGKSRLKEIGEEAYTKWKEDITKKHLETLELVENNINEISSRLIEYYKIPIDPKEYVEVFNKYIESEKRFDIKNKASVDNISPDLKEIIDAFVSFNTDFFKQHLISIYLVGSVPRGEFIPGSSDVNMIVITDFDVYEAFPEHIDPIFNVKFCSEKEFLSEKMKKYQFICWSDGVLLKGKEFKFDKKEFPKPGTFLTLLLNKGFIEKLEEIKKTVSELKNPSSKELRNYSLRVVKIMLDFGFGVAMANKPFYTSSRKGRIQYIKEMFPGALRQTLTFEEIYYRATLRQRDFPLIIDTFLEKAKDNYKKLLEIEVEIKKDDKNPSSSNL